MYESKHWAVMFERSHLVPSSRVIQWFTETADVNQVNQKPWRIYFHHNLTLWVLFFCVSVFPLIVVIVDLLKLFPSFLLSFNLNFFVREMDMYCLTGGHVGSRGCEPSGLCIEGYYWQNNTKCIPRLKKNSQLLSKTTLQIRICSFSQSYKAFNLWCL